MKTGSSGSGTRGYRSRYKSERRSILEPQDRAAELYAGRMEEARETQIIIYSPRNDATAPSFPSSLWRAKRDREMIRKLNREADKQKDTVGCGVARSVVTPRRIDSVF